MRTYRQHDRRMESQHVHLSRSGWTPLLTHANVSITSGCECAIFNEQAHPQNAYMVSVQGNAAAAASSRPTLMNYETGAAERGHHLYNTSNAHELF